MQLRAATPFLIALAGWSIACSDSGPNPGAIDAGAGGGGGSGGGSDAGGGSGGAGSDLPITARSSRSTFTCAVARPRTDHSPRNWGALPALITTSGGTALFARREFVTDTPVMSSPAGQLLVGTLAPDGTFGTAAAVTSAVASDVGPMTAAARGTGMALIWVEGTKLRYAAFDDKGAIIGAAKDVVDGLGPLPLANPRMAAGADGGFGVVYSPAADLDARQVQFVVLGADGAIKAGPRRLDQATGGTQLPAAPAPTIVATADGYAMIWRAPGESRGGIDFAKADLNGAETVARHRISVTDDENVVVGGTSGFDAPTNSLIATPHGFIAGWTEARRTMSFDKGAWSTVQLARLDAAGTRLGAPVPMRAPVDSVDEIEPSLVHFGDAIGVLWGSGKHIYLCAGCTPDHRIDLLLIDPANLTPLGNVVSVTKEPSLTGGLLNRQTAVLGSSILTTFQMTFHVHATAGSAAFTCAPKP
jgi:hypothetical protein